MKTKTISESEIADLKISSLPTRPTVSRAGGGRGYSASEMKAAFDSLPLFIIKRLNSLIEEIESDHGKIVAENIKTGFDENHTLKDLFDEIGSGEILNRLNIEDESLVSHINKIKSECEEIKEQISILSDSLEFPDTKILDLGKVTDAERPYAVFAFRGTRKEWTNSNIILADGEIATEVEENGAVRFKIGNGKNLYRDLNYIDCNVVEMNDPSNIYDVVLTTGVDLRLGVVDEISLFAPWPKQKDLHCKMSLNTGDMYPFFNYSYSDFYFTGTHCENGAFAPTPNYFYTFFFFDCGREALEAVVRGVPTNVL